MTGERTTAIHGGRVGRYELEDLVAENGGSQLWRASDPALHRPVGARIVPTDSPRLAQIRQAARAAAGVRDHRIVQVLDVIETPDYLAVITEWVDGRPWSEILRDSAEPQEAVIVAYELARALQAGHARGVAHGRLRPSSVLITASNQVRLRGLAVDAALYGVAPGTDPKAADVHGVGAMLYVGLTGRWPCIQHDGMVDGLPVIGPVGGVIPSAGEVVAGVPSQLSQLADSLLLAELRPRARYRLATVDQAVLTLAQTINHPEGEPPEQPAPQTIGKPEKVFSRLAMGVVVCIAVAAGLAFAASFTDQPGAQPVPPSAPASPTIAVQPVPISIASAVDFDPDGADHSENPDLVPLAIDGDDQTAWRTVNYRTSTMAPKRGTGILLDLGLSRPISEVKLDLLGTGTTVEVRGAQTLGESPDDYQVLARAVAAPDSITLRAPIPVQTRYLLVWLTNLPFQGDDGTYVGGLREVKVLS